MLLRWAWFSNGHFGIKENNLRSFYVQGCACAVISQQDIAVSAEFSCLKIFSVLVWLSKEKFLFLWVQTVEGCEQFLLESEKVNGVDKIKT